MILVIGAIASGKREYVKGLGYAESDIACDISDARPVVCAVEALAAADPDGVAELADALCGRKVVVCCETGSGVIPSEPAVRRGREAAGRLSILLAQRADSVVRLVAGIPVKIK